MQPVYYAPVYPAGPTSGPTSGPRPEVYHQPAFYPQPHVHFVQDADPRGDGDGLSTGTLPRSLIDGEISRPRISETPRQGSPSPIVADRRVVERRSGSRSHSKRIRFEDDDNRSSSDSSSSGERVIIRSRHTPSRGYGYTENDSSTVYSFSPTRAPRAPSSSRTDKSDSEEVEKSENSSILHENAASRVRATYVFESQYTGESRLGDPHTVKLSVQRTTAVKQKHLFRWMSVLPPGFERPTNCI